MFRGVGLLAYSFTIHLTLKRADQVTVAVAIFTVQNRFATSRTKVARDFWYGGVFALVDIGHIAGVVDQFSRSTARANVSRSPSLIA